MPAPEGFEKLQAVASRRNLDINLMTILRGRLIQRCAVLVMRREFIDMRRPESKLSAVLCWYCVFCRIILERSSERKSRYQLGRCDERVRLRVAIVPPNKVTIVGRDDRVRCALCRSCQRSLQYSVQVYHQPSRLLSDPTDQHKAHTNCSRLSRLHARILEGYPHVPQWLESSHFRL